MSDVTEDPNEKGFYASIHQEAEPTLPSPDNLVGEEDSVQDAPNLPESDNATQVDSKLDVSEKPNTNAQEPEEEPKPSFDCNICFDTVSEPVVTVCGHLFCWPCIYEWLQRSPSCPVCKAGCQHDNIIPIYGRGADSTKDPRKNIPKRPSGTRPEAPQTNFFNPGGGWGGHVHHGVRMHEINLNGVQGWMRTIMLVAGILMFLALVL